MALKAVKTHKNEEKRTKNELKTKKMDSKKRHF
jgi:hypothetical protein